MWQELMFIVISERILELWSNCRKDTPTAQDVSVYCSYLNMVQPKGCSLYKLVRGKFAVNLPTAHSTYIATLSILAYGWPNKVKSFSLELPRDMTLQGAA
jgi:hypothetical protein